MTYYLKYRPKTIDELDISSVRDSLSKIVTSGEIPHAFLFAGPKGTGKTSTARILAKIINCESKKQPCNQCKQCKSINNGTNIDVIEMDAASNRGIDDIRALRDIIKLAPANAKAKIYIIDEAHMLTTEASNALLKTLEEPPEHVYFIMATTNPEKLIETIKSRTTLIQFTKATIDETKRSLQRIIKSEKIKIDEKTVEKIVKMSKGSLRDAVKLLENYFKDNDFIKNQKVFDIDKFVENLSTKQLSPLFLQIDDAVKNGMVIEKVVESLLEKLQEELVASSSLDKDSVFNKNELMDLIELVLKMQEFKNISPIEELPLQLAISKWSNHEDLKKSDDDTGGTKDEKSEDMVTNNIQDLDNWSTILTKIKQVNVSLEGLLRQSKVLEFDGKKIKLGCNYKFHKDKIEETKNRKIIEDIAFQVFEKNIRIECQLTEIKNENILSVAEEIFS